MSETIAAPARQFLGFFIAGEEYGAPILEVREIVRCEALTRVPSMPPWIRGVMNLRGSVVPVIDLSLKFGAQACAPGKWTCVIIVELAGSAEAPVVGLMADSVSQVVELAPTDIEPPPSFGTRVRADFLSGMGKQEKRFVLLLDLSKVLSAGELLAAETAAQRADAASSPGEA